MLREGETWERRNGRARRAGGERVWDFGVGNAHVLIEQWEERALPVQRWLGVFLRRRKVWVVRLQMAVAEDIGGTPMPRVAIVGMGCAVWAVGIVGGIWASGV